MSLKEIIELIQKKFPQEEISIRERNYLQNSWVPNPNPKYLYRGENNCYPQTKSFLQRLQENDAKFFDEKQWAEIQELILDLSVHLTERFHKFVPRSNPSYEANIVSIGGYLQHYGFPLYRIDFTSDLFVAAYFAASNNRVGNVGQIGIIESSVWIKQSHNRIEKLVNSFAARPRAQQAYSLQVYEGDDLKKNSIVTWLNFEFTEGDQLFSSRIPYLSTKGDAVAKEIFAFLCSRIEFIQDEKVKAFIQTIVSNLILLR